jgi:hypothetical protein
MTTSLTTEWVVGFVDGEGCFHIGFRRHPGLRTGIQVLPEFVVTQHASDVQILHALKAFWGCGVVRRQTPHGVMCYRVRNITHLRERIVPFFEAHSLKTRKKLAFLRFRQVLRRMERGDHLTPDGVRALRALGTTPFDSKSESTPS